MTQPSPPDDIGDVLGHTSPLLSLLITLPDQPGQLAQTLALFQRGNINLTHIESRPGSNGQFDFYVDCNASVDDANVQALLTGLRTHAINVLLLDSKSVPWFPRTLPELTRVVNNVLSAGAELTADHPGFADPVYRERRDSISRAETVAYTGEEHAIWTTIYHTLRGLHERYACSAYQTAIATLEANHLFTHQRIPDITRVSEYLQRKTGFRIHPVAGLLSSRDFLSGLAFKVFFSTRYIRHGSVPLYTPEPDVCHELIGHTPMFLDPEFAALSQEIGLASLGASDHEIDRLARCYWFSVEFGLVREQGAVKAYGAGLLSSAGEMAHACSLDASNLNAWQPEDAAATDYPITTYQQQYFVADSLEQAHRAMSEHCKGLPRPFYARHNPVTDTIWVDRAIVRA